MIAGSVLIFGGGSIGAALAHLYCDHDDVCSVTLVWHKTKPKVRHLKLQLIQQDIINAADFELLLNQTLPDIVISTLGVLHQDSRMPEKSISQFNSQWYLQSQQVNVTAQLLIAQAINQYSSRDDHVIYAVLSARVGSIRDNRSGGWYSYRASKAALNMAMTTLALEWRRTRPNFTVLMLHPGTVASALSQPFQKSVPKDKLFSAMQAAGYLVELLANANPARSGEFLAWDGSGIEW